MNQHLDKDGFGPEDVLSLTDVSRETLETNLYCGKCP